MLFLGVILLGCKSKEKIKPPYSGIRIINNAEYYYGGIKEITLAKSKDINYVIAKIKNLTDDKNNEVQINVNFGYTDIKLLNKESKEEEYFSIVYTEFYGDVIRYGGKHYYYNQELVDFIKKKLKMWKAPRREDTN
jgi:hypothetical protein